MLINDTWQPRWEVGSLGNFNTAFLKAVQKVQSKYRRYIHILLSQPLSIDTLKEAVQSSLKVLIALMSLLLDDIYLHFPVIPSLVLDLNLCMSAIE